MNALLQKKLFHISAEYNAQDLAERKRVTSSEMFHSFAHQYRKNLPTQKPGLGEIMYKSPNEVVQRFEDATLALFLSPEFQAVHPMTLPDPSLPINKIKLDQMAPHVKGFIGTQHGDFVQVASNLSYRAEDFGHLKTRDRQALAYRRCLEKFLAEPGFLTTLGGQVIVADILQSAYGDDHEVKIGSTFDDFAPRGVGFDIAILSRAKEQITFVDLTVGGADQVKKDKRKEISRVATDNMESTELACYLEQQGWPSMNELNLIGKTLPLSRELMYGSIIPDYIGKVIEGTPPTRGHSGLITRLIERGFPEP